MSHSQLSDPPAAPLRSASGHDITPLDRATVEVLASALTDEERRVMLHEGTEPPFCGGLLSNKEAGVYTCRLCGLPLFASDAKFESSSGWPSFYQPVDEDHVHELRDASHGMVRVEIRCARCGGHLGHVFEDGPRPTGRRHCLNSAALEFTEEGASLPQKLAGGA